MIHFSLYILPTDMFSICLRTLLFTCKKYKIISKNWKLKYPTRAEWTNTLWYIHSNDYYLQINRKINETCNNMGEYPKNFINRNKPESKGYILYDPIYMAALWAMTKEKTKEKTFSLFIQKFPEERHSRQNRSIPRTRKVYSVLK